MRTCNATAALIVAVAGFVVFAGGRADAQTANSFHVAHMRVAMDIQRDGTMNVVETLDVDFAQDPHHGIYRYFIVRFNYDPDPKYERVYKIRHIHVSATGVSAHTVVSDAGRLKTLKIGSGDHTVTGLHTYVISYTVAGALNGFADHDELYWNVTGNDWQVPIDATDVAVRAPDGIQDVRCFSGAQGSTQSCRGAHVRSPQEADFTEAQLWPGTGLTIAVALAKHVVAPHGTAPILEERWAFQRAFALTPTTVGGSVTLFVILGLLVISKLWQTGRDQRSSAGGNDERIPMFEHHGGPVRYRPPDDARPAEVGVLIDESADPLDVTATIVDFGVRGYLTIEETEKAGVFHKADWKLTKTKEPDKTLLPYERTLFDALFEGRDDVKLSELRNTFAADLHRVQNELYDDAVKTRKWFAQRPDRVRAKYVALGVLALVASIGVTVALAVRTHMALIGVPLIVIALVVLASAHAMPARTGKGSDALDQVMGFRTYMATAEADRMKFAEEENVFAKYLPYAIVFHETARWAKVFHDIYGDNPPPGMGWYTPYGSWNAFSFGNFASSMSSFAVQTSGTIVSTPSASGSSGFGGGGFSGGGGGGGGGGGW